MVLLYILFCLYRICLIILNCIIVSYLHLHLNLQFICNFFRSIRSETLNTLGFVNVTIQQQHFYIKKLLTQLCHKLTAQNMNSHFQSLLW